MLPVSENVAWAIGLVLLILVVAVAVAVFMLCGFKNSPYEFIDREPFEVEYGVTDMVKQNAYKPFYTKQNIVATCLLILSPIPLFAGAFTEKEFLVIVMSVCDLFAAYRDKK